MSEFTHAGAVVVRETEAGLQFLIVGSSRGCDEWVLPKGHIEAGESAEAAALREVREEAGVVGELVARAGTSDYQGPRGPVRAVFFVVRCVREMEPEERRPRRWCDREDALRRLSFADSRDLVARAAELADP